MENQNQVFKYNGNSITFQIGDGDTMVNATEMAKPFGKTPKDFFRTEAMKEFCIMLCECKSLEMSKWAKMPIRNTTDFANSFPQLVVCKQGRPELGGGVWFHKDLAFEFARWLNPKFAIWCNDRILEILKGQYASPSQLTLSTDQGMILVQALDKATELMKNYVPRMWQPHCENAIAPVDFSKIVKRCTKERPDVHVDNSIVAHYMAGEGFVKFSDGYYFPTQKGIDYGVFNINDIDFFQTDGQSMKFGLPVLTETGVAFIAPKLVDMRIWEDFIKYPPNVS